jgi:hypothetical protein
MAFRLSRFIWGTNPDEELVRVAAKKQLLRANVLEQQVRRLLKDERARGLVDTFFSKWLGLERLAQAAPDPTVFPEFDSALRADMLTETRRFLEMQLRDDRPVAELLTADYTFVNERLAQHYGIDGVKGPRFRRVRLPGTRRAGLLGQASILTLTSDPTGTSPVQRAVWVLDTLLGTPPSRKLFSAPLKESSASQSGRQRFEQHRRAPQCAVCHIGIDPTGFALENFDALGRWRDTDRGLPVDTTGAFFDGTPLNGPVRLREALLERKRAFTSVVVEHMLAFGVRRSLSHHDMPVARKIMGHQTGGSLRWSTVVIGVAQSAPFQAK